MTQQKLYKNYAEKKIAQKNGSYQGTSPFYSNIPEYKHDMDINNYPHIREMKKTMNFKTPSKREPWQNTASELMESLEQ